MYVYFIHVLHYTPHITWLKIEEFSLVVEKYSILIYAPHVFYFYSKPVSFYRYKRKNNNMILC